MRISTAIGGALLALLLGGPASAASAADGTPAGTTQPAASAATRPPGPAENSHATAAAGPSGAGKKASGADQSAKGHDKSEPNPGDFIPSEEISEDYAVSFPVDI